MNKLKPHRPQSKLQEYIPTLFRLLFGMIDKQQKAERISSERISKYTFLLKKEGTRELLLRGSTSFRLEDGDGVCLVLPISLSFVWAIIQVGMELLRARIFRPASCVLALY